MCLIGKQQMSDQMTNSKLANELRAIGLGFDKVLADERDEAIKLERRFAEDQGAIEKLLRSV